MNHSDHSWETCPDLNRVDHPMAEAKVEGCDAPNPSFYMKPGGGFECRCIVCARCGHHTGNATQGHYWAYCDVTRTRRDFHMCCPGDCELEAGS